MNDFVSLINEVGFPIAAALGLGLFIWKLINRLIDGMETKLETLDDKVQTVVFPNPASDQLNVTLKGNINEIKDVKIYNSLGQIVRVVDCVNFNKNQAIDISELNEGVHVLFIQTTKICYKLFK